MSSFYPNLSANATAEETPFHKILQVLEHQAGLTEREVLQRLEIPRSTYRSWKDGVSEPSRRIYWRKLARVFGSSLDQLIFGCQTRQNDHIPMVGPRTPRLPSGERA